MSRRRPTGAWVSRRSAFRRGSFSMQASITISNVMAETVASRQRPVAGLRSGALSRFPHFELSEFEWSWSTGPSSVTSRPLVSVVLSKTTNRRERPRNNITCSAKSMVLQNEKCVALTPGPSPETGEGREWVKSCRVCRSSGPVRRVLWRLAGAVRRIGVLL